ncbi:MAG TPA: PEP-CTERM sorting domain-containing protein [Pirellulales bacterium]|jgi:hypothetical protein|nr:PEP-CTERM sorting domain-containing protein [Pirellulales bacterium]
MIRTSGMWQWAGAVMVLLLGRQACADSLYLGTATGGVGIYYNNNGGGESPTNIAYFQTQFSATNTNGGTFNFDPNLFGAPGYGSSHLFQSVPNQFGLDFVDQASTSDGSVPTPVLTAYNNVDGNVADRAAAGPVGWAISFYTGATDGPSNPSNAADNSLFRGSTGSLSVDNLTQSGSIFTVTIGGTLGSDGLIHWYSPSASPTPFAGISFAGEQATGNLLFSGTLSYDSSADANPLMDFYSGSVDVYLELVPTPEPSSLVLCGLGAALIGALAVKRRVRGPTSAS